MEVTAGIFVKDRCILLMRRAPGQSAAGGWEYPGGKIEPGESGEQCLRRELNEELSLSSRSYGILAKEKIGRSWITVAVTAPFSNDYGTAHQLAESCSARQLSPPHLVDVVSDFIS